MLKNKVTILLVFIILLGVIIYNVVFFYNRKPKLSVNTNAKKNITKVIPAKTSNISVKTSVNKLEISEAVKQDTKNWDRNPFAEKGKSLKEFAPYDFDKLKIQGITTNGDTGVAMINGKVYTEGADVNGAKILKIKRHSVIFKYGNTKKEVLLY